MRAMFHAHATPRRGSLGWTARRTRQELQLKVLATALVTQVNRFKVDA